MSDNGTPILDERDAAQVFGELLARRPAYVPEWLPAEKGAAQALLQIFARYMQVVIDRLNRAPERNLLAFLDMLGISLIPAQAARAPVVFQSLPTAVDGRIAARTRLGAQVPGRADPVVFETENAIAMAAARLVEVMTLWPARDEYADHSTDAAGGRPFTLFEPRQPMLHEFYLAHDTLLALTGDATVEIEFELATPGSDPLKIAWEYWNGQIWRPFKPFDATGANTSQDGTGGLTRSGVITLRAECGQSEKTTVKGIDAYWLRGRLDQPLPPDPARVLPMIDRLRLRTIIGRPPQQASSDSGCAEDLQPDQALADSSKLDLSKTFFPFGRSPDCNSAFYFASDEAFGKPGAEVTVCFQSVPTPEKEADSQVAAQEPKVNEAATLIVDAARSAAQTVLDAAQGVKAITEALDEADALQVQIDALQTAIKDLVDVPGIDGLFELVQQVVSVINTVTIGPVPFWAQFFTDNAEDRLKDAGNQVKAAAMAAQSALDKLSQLSPLEAAAVDGGQTTIPAPKLAWEYWNGQRWHELNLIGPADNNAANFLKSGEVAFVVPDDLEPSAVNGITARWLRVRLASGSYNHLRLISWYDSQSEKINLFPILEPRPPALEAFFLGYVYRSPWKHPEHCLASNDFQFEVHTHDVRWPGSFFPPFRPVADTTPTLYLGFDRPLPNDLVSLYLDIQETEEATPPLVWETWDGMAWRQLSVTDETAGLRRPGMVSFIAPDVAPRPQATVRRTSGTQVVVGSALETAVFQPGDQVVIRLNNEAGETAAVQRIEGEVVLLETPLTGAYAGGTIGLAALPRFGTPRDWTRARLKEDGAPARSRMKGLHLNAAWSVQLQTVENEVLGSGTDQPNQTLFFRQTPVLPGEQVEVRELEGARAEVELPILKEELLQQGLTEQHIRPVSDPRTGRVTEVWVRWQPRPHLFFSGPDDRHYTVERARGRLIFGDRRLPPVGANNIRALRYRAGGGLAGNVPAGAIAQLLAGVPAQGVANPRAAEGGADGELPAAVRTRGPQTLRHRGRSLAARDYEALTREASPGVAAARALPATAPNGRPAPGWVTVIIVPQSQESQPHPSFELRRQVHDHLAARAPATVPGGRIAVIGPTYLPIGVAAKVTPRDVSEAGAVERRLQAALESFLHPLTGGPEGRGWPFGRGVYLSDVAAIVEAVEGVDYAEELDLLLNDTPQGEWVAVPPDRIVVAGPIRVEMKTPER